MNTAELLDLVEKIDKSSENSWVSNLDQRKKEELVFHDQRHDRNIDCIDRQPEMVEKADNKKYYKFVDKPREYTDDWIRKNVKGKVFLDYACGTGEYAIKASQFGAKLSIGIDISGESINTARAIAKRSGVENVTRFYQGDCEKTELPDESIDVVLCCGMLHHLDLNYAYPELQRILKPGGKILAFEALDYNPIIKLYRMLTPHLRTNWEKKHILSLKDVRFAKKFFTIGELRYWNILTILSPHIPFLAKTFSAIDSILTRIPGIQLFAWIFTFEMIKKNKD